MKLFENSKEFNEIQKTLKIPFTKAEEIFLDYHKKNTFNTLEPLFYYYSDNFYYFGYKTDASKDKQNKSFYFLELKINAITGETEEIDEAIKDWR